jgi:outer membrane immunogenic protein
MKSLRDLLLTTASSVALVGTAAAADMPVKAAPAPVVWNWAGPYVGLNVGAAWNDAKFSDLLGPGGFFAFAPPNNDPFWSSHQAGFTFGGQAGYNWQSGNIVYGVEGDLNWVDSKASTNFLPLHSVAATSNLDWMATGRGRLGVAYSQFLIYGTGGVAFAHFKDVWGFIPTGAQDFSSSSVRVGWTAGGGVEYMLSRNWSLGVEALYADFASTTVNGQAFGGTYTSGFKHSVTTARGALNWKW